ncbi:hypothetical protein QAD02_010022 [Eretmocerus hayati]|uniref:Uncharacterized protein n=1 Tax=Eretmocerus hayati TaxID=131215 RepID=A0ACC2NDE0_9HYME|nr:hypothetical protein QAD02_010022 [Eretmocerus hayati]
MIEEPTTVKRDGITLSITASSGFMKVDQNQEDNVITRVYKRRWLVLILYIAYASLVSGQCFQYFIISNVIMRYYNVSAFAVDSTSMLFLLILSIFIFPMSYVTERLGLRRSIILGCGLCTLGCWIKNFSVSPDGFLITLLGQAVVALSATIMLLTPGQVSAAWFGVDELSTATSLGVFGNQLGVAIWFLLPPVMVKNHDNIIGIGHELSEMFWILTISSSITFILIIAFFQNEPKLPPSETRALQKNLEQEKTQGFFKPMKRLLTNKSFLILCNSYGISVGNYNVFGTLLNQLFLVHFANGEEDAGRIGFAFILTGMLGSITFGIILDKTHKFKWTAVTVYFLTLCGQIFFAVSLFLGIKWMVYASSIFLGFFMTGYLALGYEMATEYTYPDSETLSAGILNITPNIYGIVLVLILERLLENFGDEVVHVVLCAVLFMGLILTIITKDEHRRQDARNIAKIAVS